MHTNIFTLHISKLLIKINDVNFNANQSFITDTKSIKNTSYMDKVLINGLDPCSVIRQFLQLGQCYTECELCAHRKKNNISVERRTSLLPAAYCHIK